METSEGTSVGSRMETSMGTNVGSGCGPITTTNSEFVVMKTRTGFVSNSSSSSFVLDKKIFSCPAEVAYSMLMEREWLDDEEMVRKLKEYYSNETITEETNLSFPSINYNTFIWNSGDKIKIDTCNNTDWKFPDEVKSTDREGCDEEKYSKSFFELKKDFIGSPLDDGLLEEVAVETGNESISYFCQTCPFDLWVTETSSGEKQIICPSCKTINYKKPIGEKWVQI